MSIWVNFWIKAMKKWHVRKTYRLKLEFYYIDRKMKNNIRHAFSWIVMTTNFIFFLEENKFRNCALESFASIDGNLATALTPINSEFMRCWNIEILVVQKTHISRNSKIPICPSVVLFLRYIPCMFYCSYYYFFFSSPSSPAAKQSAVLAQQKKKRKKKVKKTALFVVFQTTMILRKSTDPVDKSLAIFLAGGSKWERNIFLGRTWLKKRGEHFFLTFSYCFLLSFLLPPSSPFFAWFSVTNTSAVH